MRPDPRLLLEVSALPFVPEGAQLWRPDGRRDAPWWVSRMEDTPAPDRTLDCSAPTKRGGLDERWDLLPWLLTVLGWRRIGHIDDVLKNTRMRAVQGSQMEVWDATGFHWHSDPWPDLSGLTPDEAARAVVISAIRQRAKVSP